MVAHVGRTSGRTYRTPVTPIPAGDGYAIALPYGEQTDWVRNVLAAGSATIRLDGEDVPVIEPRVVPLGEHAASFGTFDRFGAWLFGVRTCLAVRRAG